MKRVLSLGLAGLVLLSPSAWAESTGEQILQLQQQMAVMQGELSSLIAVQKASRGSQKALGDLLSRSQQQGDELRQLRGDLETKTHALEEQQKSTTEQLAALSTAVANLSSPATAATASTSSAAAKTLLSPKQILASEASSASPTLVNGLGQADYQRAFGLLQAGKYGTAVTALQGFVRKYPQSSLVVNAYYWLGQAQYVLGHNGAAIQNLQTAARYTQSSKAPEALLRMAEIYQAIGKKSESRSTLQQILQQYPHTPTAQKAQAQLQAMH